MQQLTLDKVIGRKKEIATADLGLEVGMLDEENGMYYALGGVGTRIWHIMEHEMSINAIVEQLLLEYDVKKEVCQKDVLEFIDRMLTSELIYISNSI